MGFVKKEAIVKVAEDFVEAQRQNALNSMREEISQKLEKALEIAGEIGDDFAYTDIVLTIPEFFEDSNGYYAVPELIEKELAEAGYRVRWVKGNHYSLI